MRTVYLDCRMGAAGDMLAAALLELQPDRDAALARLNAIGLDGVSVSARRMTRAGLAGTLVDVSVNGETEEGHHHGHCDGAAHHHHHHHATMEDIDARISALNASDAVKEHVRGVYRLVADAEAEAHGRPVAEVHFHEVGAMDAICDVASVSLLLEALAPVRVVSSVPEAGGGFVRCAHGEIPVPAPATVNILRGIPFSSGAADMELLTPTGAALLRHFADEFGPMPTMAVERTGVGCGHRELAGRANVVRAFLGEAQGAANDRIVELKANIDDMTGEELAFACERLRDAGARDVSLVPATMKHGRPGQILVVLAAEADADRLAEAVLRETTTFGVRRTDCVRYALDRNVERGDDGMRVKSGNGYGVSKSKREFADRADCAKRSGEPIAQVAR
ncbi:MAG: nickel pincer cofactor biosynthesis protein LarC [Kiritimatiellae bacterium]|nr:nickel pincer cofactor biosynthesis protein LarC [Kiritimatiellia bacterium]